MPKKPTRMLNVRLPEHMYEDLQNMAEDDDSTITDFVKRLIKKAKQEKAE